jgi:predicted aspartyl protease
MGVVFLEGTVTGPRGKRATPKFLVDSGTTYTLLPRKLWRAIGMKPIDSATCVFADGAVVKMKVSECRIVLPQGERSTPMLLGERGGEALLGVVTIGILGLILNPYTRKLHPMRMLLM